MADEPNKPGVDPDKPADPPVDKPADVPADKPADKPADPKPVVVPDKYDLKPAQGSPFTDKDVETVAAEARSLGLSHEQAKTFFETLEKRHIAGLENHVAEVTRVQTEWQETLKKDEKLGGEKYTQTVAERTSLLDKYAKATGDVKFVEELTTTQFIHHPMFNRFLAWVASASREDVPPAAGDPPAPTVDRNDNTARAKRMFPSST